MKKIIIISLFILSLAWSAEAPFSRGVNLTNWFQKGSAQEVQFTKFTRQDFANIKSLGCDVIRLPVNLHYMTGGEPDYTVDPLFYYFFDQVVDIAEELEIHLILDNHTFDPSVDTDPDIGDILVPVWTQIADHYKNCSTYLYYEVLNEPHGISDAAWNEIQYNVIDAIRSVDTVHTIVVGPAGWNGYSNLQYMPEYTDDNLVYTFHFYDPFLFTHQGASWTDPSMVPLAGVPFPYDADSMPDCPAELIGTWIESSLNNYHNDGTVARVQQLIDIADAFMTERDVPLLCGEFGVYIPNSDNDERVYWYNIVRSYLEDKGIAWTIWDYTGGFGLFEEGGGDLFDYDLNIPLVEALGLTAPQQYEFVLEPDTTGFALYLDYIGPRIVESSWSGDGILSYYSEDNPAVGEFCIYWTGVGQYNHIGFNFVPIKDLSLLVENGYVLDFRVRGDSPASSFDIRFLDTKTDDPDDHPWRMRVIIDDTFVPKDGEWHHLQIPLDDFTEQGSWDNEEWFEPQGDFDWGNVEQFQIVSEHHALDGIKFWFDQIRVIDPTASGIKIDKGIPLQYRLCQNYPNPFNPATKISYTIPQPGFVAVKVYDVLGKEIETLVSKHQAAGEYSVYFNAKDLPCGIYFYTLLIDDSIIQTKKMLYLK
jgi:endoglucanase